MSDTQIAPNGGAPKAKGLVLVVIYVTALFFIWAFVTNLVDPLVKAMKIIYKLSDAEAQLNQFAFFIAYGVMSIPSAWYLASNGYARSIILGLATIVGGCLIAFTTVYTHTFVTVLLGLFVAASGITLLQVAANPLIAAMGDEKGAHFRLNLSQAFNSMGAFLGGMYGSGSLLQGPMFAKNAIITEAMKPAAIGVVTGVYLKIAFILAIFTLAVFLVRNMINAHSPVSHDINSHSDSKKNLSLPGLGVYVGVLASACITLFASVLAGPVLDGMGFGSVAKTIINLLLMLIVISVLIKLVFGVVNKKFPELSASVVDPLISAKDKWAVLGSVGIFLYVGAEVCVISGMIFFLEQEQIMNLPAQVAGFVGPLFMLFAMFGRFIGSWALKYVKATQMLLGFAACAALLCLFVIGTYNMQSVPMGGKLAIPTFPGFYNADLATGFFPGIAAILIGFFNSIMFPTIFTITLERSDAPASATSGLMCLAICGGGFISVAYGFAVDSFIAHFHAGARSLAFIVPFVCYVYVLWFAYYARSAATHKIEEGVAAAH